MNRFLLHASLRLCALLAGIGGAPAAPLFYVSEGTHAIDQLTSGGIVNTYATFPGTSSLPEGLALGTSGTLYIADGGIGRIWSIPPNGALQVFAETGNQRYNFGLAIDSSGNIFSANSGGSLGQIDKVTPAGVVSTFVTLPASASPFGLVFDSSGNLFTSDSQLRVIYKITPQGTVSTFASLPSGSPTGLAFDTSGNLFASVFSGAIYRITPGGTVSPFVTLPASAGLKGLAFDSSGNLYVAEQNRNVIGEITPGGVVTDFASVHAPQFLQLVPEPSALAMLGVGALLLVAWRRR